MQKIQKILKLSSPAGNSNISATETVEIPIGGSSGDEEEKKEETKESTSDVEESKTAATTSEASDNNLSAQVSISNWSSWDVGYVQADASMNASENEALISDTESIGDSEE